MGYQGTNKPSKKPKCKPSLSGLQHDKKFLDLVNEANENLDRWGKSDGTPPSPPRPMFKHMAFDHDAIYKQFMEEDLFDPMFTKSGALSGTHIPTQPMSAYSLDFMERRYQPNASFIESIEKKEKIPKPPSRLSIIFKNIKELFKKSITESKKEDVQNENQNN